jgi:hypothetical protein
VIFERESGSHTPQCFADCTDQMDELEDRTARHGTAWHTTDNRDRFPARGQAAPTPSRPCGVGPGRMNQPAEGSLRETNRETYSGRTPGFHGLGGRTRRHKRRSEHCLTRPGNRNRSLNPQVLGSNPRGRTKRAGQTRLWPSGLAVALCARHMTATGSMRLKSLRLATRTTGSASSFSERQTTDSSDERRRTRSTPICGASASGTTAHRYRHSCSSVGVGRPPPVRLVSTPLYVGVVSDATLMCPTRPRRPDRVVMSRSSMGHASDALRVRPATAASWLNNQRSRLVSASRR